MSKWSTIPQFPRAHYEVDFRWDRIELALDEFGQGVDLNLDPDYQRSHVWSEAQQRAYVEYVLQGGGVGRNLTWNSRGWPNTMEPIELVDGKQRLEAVRKFIRGELDAFGMRFEPGDLLRFTQASFRFRVCSLDRADVLRLYLNINAGGTPHTGDELDRVRSLLDDAVGLSEDERRYVEAVRRGSVVHRGMSPPLDKACTYFVAGFLGVDPRVAGRRLASLERKGVLAKTVHRVDGKPMHCWEVVS